MSFETLRTFIGASPHSIVASHACMQKLPHRLQNDICPGLHFLAVYSEGCTCNAWVLIKQMCETPQSVSLTIYSAAKLWRWLKKWLWK